MFGSDLLGRVWGHPFLSFLYFQGLGHPLSFPMVLFTCDFLIVTNSIHCFYQACKLQQSLKGRVNCWPSIFWRKHWQWKTWTRRPTVLFTKRYSTLGELESQESWSQTTRTIQANKWQVCWRIYEGCLQYSRSKLLCWSECWDRTEKWW